MKGDFIFCLVCGLPLIEHTAVHCCKQMTHLSRVIWSWRPSPSDLKCSHSDVAIINRLITADAAVAVCKTIGRVTGTKRDRGDICGRPAGTLLMDGERLTKWNHERRNRKRQKLPTARGLWPQKVAASDHCIPLVTHIKVGSRKNCRIGQPDAHQLGDMP